MTGNVWGSGTEWGSSMEKALIMLLRAAKSESLSSHLSACTMDLALGRSCRDKMEAFLGILPVFKEDHLSLLKLGITPYTGKSETILAVMNALSW